MLGTALALCLLAPLTAEDETLVRSSISDKDLSKIAKDVTEYFTALDGYDRAEQQKLLDSITEDMDKAAKKAKLDGHWLRFLGDWEFVLEESKPEDRDLKAAIGKGFVRHVFTDPYDGIGVACLLSIPADYKKRDTFAPAIVALKPTLGLSGADLDQRVTEMAEALYGEEFKDAIILVPIGKESGTGRSAESTEVVGSWLADEGMYTLFTAFRVLLEQLRFDRSRVVVDGWGDAGVDALRLAATTSWFAGAINRGGAIADDVLLENLARTPLLVVPDDGDEAGVSDRLGDGLQVTVQASETGALEPDAEVRAAIATWAAECTRELAPDSIEYKLGDLRFQAVDWLKATSINRRPTANPDDPDFPRISASVDPASNTISIDTVNVFGLYVFLSDDIVDLDREVVVEVNGEPRVRKSFPRNLRTLLENRFFNNSGECGLYTASVLIEDIEANVP